jgi:hypothetical protein
MTDDVRVAISALGLMRQGSLEGTTTSAPLPHPSHQSVLSTSSYSTSSALPSHAFPPSDHHSRATSSSHRSDPSRSTSTASIASNSEAWTTASGTSDTGFSSPVDTASASGCGGYSGGVGYGEADAEMGEMKGLGEAELGGQDEQQGQDPRFMARVSQLPYVSGGLEWYERSKASSRVVKVRFLLFLFCFLQLVLMLLWTAARCRPRRVVLLRRIRTDNVTTRRSRRLRLPPTRPDQRGRFSWSQITRFAITTTTRVFSEDEYGRGARSANGRGSGGSAGGRRRRSVWSAEGTLDGERRFCWPGRRSAEE